MALIAEVQGAKAIDGIGNALENVVGSWVLVVGIW